MLTLDSSIYRQSAMYTNIENYCQAKARDTMTKKELNSFSRQAIDIHGGNECIQSLVSKYFLKEGGMSISLNKFEKEYTNDIWEMFHILNSHRFLLVLPSTPRKNRGSRKKNIKSDLIWDSSKNASSDINPLISSGERLNTFVNWSISSCKWWPRMLADAGFYYNHTDLECFQCRLRTNPEKWLPKETPKEAHARISPECAFVKLYSRSQRCDTPESPEQRSSCDCPINPNDNSYIKHSISEQNSHLTRQPESVVVPHQNTNVMQTTALVKPLLSNDVNTSDRRGINLDNSNIQPTSDIKTATSTVCDSANNPSYTEHSIQPTIDAMNSQLTIDGFQSRIQAPAEPEYRYPQYNSYSSRYQSFGNWPFPHKQTPHSLSEAGYFYTGENDIVRCFCCDLGLAEWDPKDNAWTEHARHNPRCIFLLKEKGKQFIDDIQKDWRKIYNPKHAAFDDKESRIATFDDWRRDIEQTPEILADSGFFYTGDDDVVRCHYCDGGLRNWEPGDVPWEEHGRWFPFCKFVIKMKGREYIEEIRAKYEERQRLGNQPEISNNRSSDLPATQFASTKKPEEKDPQKLKEINKQLKDKMKCIRCRTNDICMLFVNCGHRQTCEECADLMDFCPICDTRIKKRLKTFLS